MLSSKYRPDFPTLGKPTVTLASIPGFNRRLRILELKDELEEELEDGECVRDFAFVRCLDATLAFSFFLEGSACLHFFPL